MAALRHENIRGLDIAVDDALCVCRIERVGDLDRQAYQHIGVDRPAGDAVLQRHAVQKLHGDERLAVLVVNFVDGADVGMVERRRGLGFALKAGQGLRVFGNFFRQEFQRDESVQASGLRLCKPHPSRHRRAFRRCGNARWFGRS